MSAAGLILAAGESRRMGRPKALLEYRGATFLETLVALLARRCRPVVVVLGAAADQIRARTAVEAVFVVNAEYMSGQTGSLQCGLRAVPPQADGVVLTLVDHPAVSAATVERIADGRAGDPPHVVRVPRYRGKRGHPIWLSREIVPEFLAIPPAAPARDVVRRHAGGTLFLDLDDPGIVADIDDPEAYRALVGGGR